MAGKWYNQGLQDAKEGLPIDPPWQPGHRDYKSYCEGYVDGERELDQEARLEHPDYQDE